MQQNRFRSLTTLIFVFSLCFSLTTQAASADTATNNTARCKGHGLISFEGTGTITIGGDGILIINGEDADVTFLSDMDMTDESGDEEPECYSTEEGGCVYVGTDGKPGSKDETGMEGKAQITGEDLQVSFVGANIGAIVSGTGTLSIKGYGIYIFGKDIGKWGINGTKIILDN
jgi:hypothetical protein